jgi:hypothetical protein
MAFPYDRRAPDMCDQKFSPTLTNANGWYWTMQMAESLVTAVQRTSEVLTIKSGTP